MLPTTLYAKNPDTGEYVEITQFYDQNRSPVVFDEIAPVMYDAILSSEDKNFYKHGGIDLVGTASAVYDNLRGSDTRGGSSISQQYVKNILVQRCESNATRGHRGEGRRNGRRHDRGRGARELLARSDDGQRHGGHPAQAPGDALRDRPRAEVLEERDPARLPEHRQLRRHQLRHRCRRPLLLQRRGEGPHGRPGRDAGRHGAEPELLPHRHNPTARRTDSKSESGQQRGRRLQAHEGSPGLRARPARSPTARSRRSSTTPRWPSRSRRPSRNPTTGCASAPSAAYFCQYVKNIIKTDPAFGATAEDRTKALQRGGLNIYTTLDYRLQNTAQDVMAQTAPAAIDGMEFGVAARERRGRDRPRALDGAEHAVQRGSGHHRRRSDLRVPSSTPADSHLRQFDRLLGRLDLQALHPHRLAREGPLGQGSRSTANARIIKRITNSCDGDWVNFDNVQGQQLPQHRAASWARRCSSPPPRSTRATSPWPRSSTSATSRMWRPRWA